jgi:hypothetical protein
VSGQYVPARFDYTIAGAVLASLLLFSESLAWQTAITATCAAFGWDFLDYQTFAPRPLAWTLLVARPPLSRSSSPVIRGREPCSSS